MSAPDDFQNFPQFFQNDQNQGYIYILHFNIALDLPKRHGI